MIRPIGPTNVAPLWGYKCRAPLGLWWRAFGLFFSCGLFYHLVLFSIYPVPVLRPVKWSEGSPNHQNIGVVLF